MKRFTFVAIAGAALVQAFAVPLPAAAAPGDRAILFRSNPDACYQIPAIVRTPAGTLIAAAEQRFGYNRDKAALVDVGAAVGGGGGGVRGCGDSGFINIAYRRSTDGGRNWSPGRVVVTGRYFMAGGYTVAATENPTLVADGRNVILMFTLVRSRGARNEPACIAMNGAAAAKCGGVPAEYGIWQIVSSDDGAHWQAPRPVDVGSDPKRIDRPGPGHGIVLPSGRMVVPSYAALLLSDDGGRSWRAGASTDGKPLDGGESGVALLPGGVIWSSARPSSRSYRSAGASAPIRVSGYSRDGGQSYAKIEADTRFPMPPISAGLLSWQNDLFISYPFSRQPTAGDVDMTQRHRLTVSASSDGGRSWNSCLIDAGSSAYSDMAGIDAGTIGLVYEGGLGDGASDPRGFQQAIVFRRIPLGALERCAPPA